MTTPPAPVTIVGAYTLSVNYDHSGQQSVSVLGLKAAAAQFLVQSDGQAALNAWWAAIRVALPSTVVCQGAVMREVRPSPLVVELAAPPSPTGATLTGTALPAYSFLAKWNTALGGRSGKGKTFIPGVGHSSLAVGGRSWEASTPAQINGALAAYLASAAFSSGSMKPCVISRKLGVATTIISGALAPIPGLQRRRLRA